MWIKKDLMSSDDIKDKLDVEYMDGWASKLNVSGELKELMGKVK